MVEPLGRDPGAADARRLGVDQDKAQVRLRRHACGVPLNRPGQLAIGGERKEFSATHRAIAEAKARNRAVHFVSIDDMVVSDRPSTEYLPNVTPGYRHA